jgi:MSHA biogenesis protein MshP
VSARRGALRRSHTQRGFTLIVAVFLITGLAVLGLFMVTIAGTQHQTTMLAGLGAQGYYASRAGAEWAVRRALGGQPCSTTFAPGALAGSMGDYTVTVTCSSTTHSIAGDPDITVWSVTSLAVRGALGDRDHVARTLTISFTDAP